ncbi:MAG: citrate/2-methylcitrate synthase [Ilumatobacter sp.]|uniref:citrate/2-methylcitrate synthase n=1 Tax=Ilumatobacter sp. TaxID=1967498 RepID=UPI0026140FFA|nr:citrate/2-methylcitrate synthase [Ilumatobacter sp.]MDJ0771690.1 citrate/2-methylcitrate synthase [Ilumatobacter sp.]
MQELIDVPPGLNNVAVSDTEIGAVLGEEGFFHYRQYDAVDLARRHRFEDAWHLLERGRLPDETEYESFRAAVAAARVVPADLDRLVGTVAATPGAALAKLRAVLSMAGPALGVAPLLELDGEQRRGQALRLAALVPAVLAVLHRRSVGLGAVEPDRSLGHAAGYLHSVTGITPSAGDARALEQYLMLTIDHGFNASTFTGRVVASTGADLVDVVCAALGALAGPLHGGAPSRALDALDAIGTPDRAADWVRGEVAAGRRIMGFGHAVYRAPDPRSALLREVAERLGGELVERAIAIEGEILATLRELKPDRPLPSNVEFYAGVIMASVGLPREMFTPTFAVSRTVGWVTHAVEQAAAGKLIRPAARYVGPEPGRAPAEG